MWRSAWRLFPSRITSLSSAMEQECCRAAKSISVLLFSSVRSLSFREAFIIRIKGKATPLANVMLLAIGAVVANFLGTTGASMILIRPFLRVNKYRLRGFHVVFFIFVVSNIGGALTPIGDPPLFLGYLKGVPFLWMLAVCVADMAYRHRNSAGGFFCHRLSSASGSSKRAENVFLSQSCMRRQKSVDCTTSSFLAVIVACGVRGTSSISP